MGSNPPTDTPAADIPPRCLGAGAGGVGGDAIPDCPSTLTGSSVVEEGAPHLRPPGVGGVDNPRSTTWPPQAPGRGWVLLVVPAIQRLTAHNWRQGRALRVACGQP